MAVIGAGGMLGNRIVAELALQGVRVAAHDRGAIARSKMELDGALADAMRVATDAVGAEGGAALGAYAGDAKALVSWHGSIAEAVREASLVIEAVVDDTLIKAEVSGRAVAVPVPVLLLLLLMLLP